MDAFKNDILCAEKLCVDESSVVMDLEPGFDYPDQTRQIVAQIYMYAWEDLDRHLKEKSRKLEATATKEECLEAVQELISEYEPGLELVRESIYAQVQGYLTLYIKIRKYYVDLISAGMTDLEEDLELTI
ncbi:hypothetical protein CJU90_0826 [Yarrowia sp. C11]|nr:hypothetical protein CJU90_0826 [Yarrowia sp. C11]